MIVPHRIYYILFTAIFTLIYIDTVHAQNPDINVHEVKALEIYRSIIGMRTAAGYNKVPEMAGYLTNQLKNAGFTQKDIHILTYDETAALVVRYRGNGSAGKKPILFLAHMDVVDASTDGWKHDPFQLHDDNEFFLGRGSSDNKYGVMNLVQTFIRLKQEGFMPTRDLILAFSGDEETTQGTTSLLVNERFDLIDSEFALNSDSGGGSLAEDGTPLAYTFQSAEKTYATFEITARNPGGHSAAPRKDNAIYDLANALLKIRSHRFPVMSNAILRESLKAKGEQMDGELGDALVAYSNDPINEEAINTILQSEDYDHVISTTCVATMLRGGQVENALPLTATATVNCRIFPGTEVSEIEETLEKIIANDELEIKPLEEYIASPASEPRNDVTSAISKAVHSRYPGINLVPSMSSGYTDALHYRRAGIPTYGVSSRFTKSGISNAHGLNERIPKVTFFEGLNHWIIIIKELAE
ncbi:MAG: carboxypeptidase PM20D1 [Gammaproteobacteria bacterium]|jgi:carboxypeptidase PM20D1